MNCEDNEPGYGDPNNPVLMTSKNWMATLEELGAYRFEMNRAVLSNGLMRTAIEALLAAADAKDQPATSKNIPVALIERLREVAR